MEISAITPILLILAIITLAALVRSTLGFGDALVAMPLLAFFLPIRFATPIVAFLGVVMATTMLLQNRKNVDLHESWRLMLSSLLGIPLGLLLLKNLPELYIKLALGVLLILFGLYYLFNPKIPEIRSKTLAFVLGFVGGILGGAYNTNGPPVIVYGVLSRWPPERFRATLQSYFMPTALFIFIGHGISGLWTADVLKLFLYSFPLIFLSIFVGTKLSRTISHPVFERVVYAALVVMGILMLF